jgi:hypothetical protein
MYFGHLTKRDKSRPLGRIAPPTLVLRGRDGNRGSAALAAFGLASVFFVPLGACQIGKTQFVSLHVVHLKGGKKKCFRDYVPLSNISNLK